MIRSRQAEQVGEALPRSCLHPAVLRWTEQRKAQGPWCVALSGGADSVALLILLWCHWPDKREQLVALHFNHRLRGRAADADARFCQKLCAGLGVKLVVGKWTKARPGASEAEARAARHEFFVREMKRRRSRVLWLAHQQDDIAETLLMRLARGSGAGGLAAPRPIQAMPDGRVHVRPLLTLKKSELTRLLDTTDVTWREDASNRSADHFRNRIRATVIPAWQQAAGRDAQAGAALSRELIEEDDSALEGWLDGLNLIKRRVLDVQACRSLPRALIRRALHRWLMAVKPRSDLSRQGFSLLLAAVENRADTRFSLGRGFAVIRSGKLMLSRN